MDIIFRRKRGREGKRQRLVYRKFLRQNRERNDPFKMLSNKQFRLAFRLNKSICRHVIGLLRPHMMERQKHGISITTRVLCALRFFAHGCYQFPVSSDPFISVSPSSVSRAILEVSTAIVDHLGSQYIRFPDQTERVAIKQK